MPSYLPLFHHPHDRLYVSAWSSSNLWLSCDHFHPGRPLCALGVFTSAEQTQESKSRAIPSRAIRRARDTSLFVFIEAPRPPSNAGPPGPSPSGGEAQSKMSFVVTSQPRRQGDVEVSCSFRPARNSSVTLPPCRRLQNQTLARDFPAVRSDAPELFRQGTQMSMQGPCQSAARISYGSDSTLEPSDENRTGIIGENFPDIAAADAIEPNRSGFRIRIFRGTPAGSGFAGAFGSWTRSGSGGLAALPPYCFTRASTSGGSRNRSAGRSTLNRIDVR